MKLGRNIAIKPILNNAEIFRLDEPSTSVLQKAWEAILAREGTPI